MRPASSNVVSSRAIDDVKNAKIRTTVLQRTFLPTTLVGIILIMSLLLQWSSHARARPLAAFVSSSRTLRVATATSTTMMTSIFQPSISARPQQVRCLGSSRRHKQRMERRRTLLAAVMESPQNDDNDNDNSSSVKFQPGQPVLVEVTSFGPLGASVTVVNLGHAAPNVSHDHDDWPTLGTGLISQKEIQYFRTARDHVDVVRGELLPAYIEQVRDTDGKLRIGLRAFGGLLKTREFSAVLLETLQNNGGGLELGDKSHPNDIQQQFPGISKTTFKKAVAKLFKEGKLQKPQAQFIALRLEGTDGGDEES